MAALCTKIAAVLLVVGLNCFANGIGVVEISGTMPPPNAAWVTQPTVPGITGTPTCFPGTTICLSDATLGSFIPINSYVEGSAEYDTSGATMTGDWTIAGQTTPFSAVGQQFLIINGKTSEDQTGAFTAQMYFQVFDTTDGFELQTTGDPLPGSVTIADIGGNYYIQSFFDLFLEVSPDSGATWYPAESGLAQPWSTRMALEA